VNEGWKSNDITKLTTMRQNLLAIIFMLAASVAIGQETSKEYKALIEKGRSFYSAKDYKNAASSFSTAVNMPGNKVPLIDWHRAAWSQALVNNADSAFYYLDIIANKKGITFSDFVFIVGDKDYTPILNDNRWKAVKEKIFNNARESFYARTEPSVFERYNAAFAWVINDRFDSAWHQLQLVSASKDLSFHDVDVIIHNDIFDPLEKDKQWNAYTKTLYTALYKKYIPQNSFKKISLKKRIAIDEGHFNLHTINGTYAVLAGTLKEAGFNVSGHTGPFSTENLANVDVLIIANPFPDIRDSLIARANRAGEPFRYSSAATRSAFTNDEVEAIRNWVSKGGSLLLILDHAPHGKTGELLAAAFGVESRNVSTLDRASRDPEVDTTEAATILFTKSKGLLGEHLILTDIDSVTTYTGESLLGPPRSAVLLTLPSTAIDLDWDASTKKFRNLSANGRVQALAFEYNPGRVVVLGEAAMTNPLYTSRSNRGNWKMTLNIFKWLTRSI
jgi:hypothetical protein